MGDPRVVVLDPGQLTLGVGLLALEVARLGSEGKSLPEIVARVEEMAERTYTFAALDTLEHLRRSGRLNSFQSYMGSLLQVKPLLKMHEGVAEMERVRTRRQATRRLVELLRDLGPLEQLALVHTHALDRATALWQEVQPLAPPELDPLVGEVTPLIGAHIGPGAVGFVCVKA